MVVPAGVPDPSVNVVGLPSHAVVLVKLAVGRPFMVIGDEWVFMQPLELVTVKITENGPVPENAYNQPPLFYQNS